MQYLKDIIYESEFLIIEFEKEHSLFVQTWKKSPNTLEEFKIEMLNYTKMYGGFKPKYTLWNQTNYSQNIDFETQLWIEKHVNIPCLEYGNQKCAFIVSKDVLAHVDVIDAFDKLKSCIVPKHFISKAEAREWLFEEDNVIKQNNQKRIIYEGVDEDGNMIVKLPLKNVKKTYKSLNNLLQDENFHSVNEIKFNQLTRREKEILRVLAKGLKHKEIAQELSVSIHTVRTHIKNIKLKLEVQKNEDFLNFMRFFRD